MKKKKVAKLLSLALAGMIILSGCGNTDTKSNDKAESSSEVQAEGNSNAETDANTATTEDATADNSSG